MEKYTDAQLIELYMEGNFKALDGIIYRYSQPIFRFVFHTINNTEETNDIVQETFIKVWKNIRKFDQKKSFRTWLFTIAQRTMIDFLRKRRNVNFSESNRDNSEIPFEETIPDEELIASEILEKTEDIELVKTALSQISIENRSIILLHNGEEMTFKEISEIFNKPINTIKSQYRRSLISVKNYIINVNAPKS